MKLLLENWREYTILNERINSLDPDSGRRFINGLLAEMSENDNVISIPDKEMAGIRKWGGLKGEPSFLGAGSRGSAYKFEDKVLKFTNDRDEAEGAALLAGKMHPNVYDVYGSGQRSRENMKNSTLTKQYTSYVVVYKFLNYPTNAMTDVAFKLYHHVRGKNKEMFYRWETSNSMKARELISEFVRSIKEDPMLLGATPDQNPSASENTLPKIKRIADDLGWSNEQHKLFEIMWTLIGGAYAHYLDSSEAVEEYANKITSDPRFEHFHQLALGLTFLKENGITFDDLKASNIMEKNGQAAIIDVGYSMIEGNPELPEIEQ